ncbi:hypothetical protein MJG53_016655 [Ovis ammon polii x Ovis aries]|uniref:Uncharacterized protein n=1 Tax=Ovis ammon polii x Ovis aries TaxID=2918886 RepID=A0ACB9U9U9_9CETA|nr:hypothetical protein MJG53_016655 [Ovis ammon polii x Ovis aries]
MKLSVDDMEEDGKRGKVSIRGQPLVELGFAAGTSTQITVTLPQRNLCALFLNEWEYPVKIHVFLRCGTCQTLSLNLTTALHAEPQSQLRRPASLSIHGAKRYGGRPDLDICNVAGLAKGKGSGHVLQEGQCQIKDANKYPRIFFKDENTDLQKASCVLTLSSEKLDMQWVVGGRERGRTPCPTPELTVQTGRDQRTIVIQCCRISPRAFLCWEKPGKAETEGNGDQKAYTGWFLKEVLGMMCVQNEKEETAANMYAFVEVMYPKCWYSLAKTRQRSGLEKILMQHGILSQCRGNTQIASPG